MLKFPPYSPLPVSLLPVPPARPLLPHTCTEDVHRAVRPLTEWGWPLRPWGWAEVSGRGREAACPGPGKCRGGPRPAKIGSVPHWPAGLT